MNAIKEFWDEHRLILVTVFGMIGIIIALIVLSAVDAQKWEQFKKDRNCRVVSHEKGSVHTGISSDGKVVTLIESDKTGWLCDDGIEQSEEYCKIIVDRLTNLKTE